jgi:2',3'-cyclic-nucleotide 2'-phosphodiesterase (5'-nucleotidase family)
MGGLARRAGYIRAFKEKFKDVPAIAVDTGHWLADERTTHGGLRIDAVAKSDWVLKAYDRFAVEVANLSAYDLVAISHFIAKAGNARPREEFPQLKRVVSANIVNESAGRATPQKFIVKEIGKQQPKPSGTRPLKVAFMGLSETAPTPPQGFKITDPLEAARRVVPEARRAADFIVVLAHLSIAEAVGIAREVPGIDVLIAGNSEGGNGPVFTPPIKVGATQVLFTPYETRMLGELRVYRGKQGDFSTRARFISLDAGVPDDPMALEVVNAWRSKEGEARRSAKQLLNDWLASSRATLQSKAAGGSAEARGAFNVSATACAQCHVAQYIQWSSSRHGHATDSIVKKQTEFDASCLSCHASVFEKTAKLAETETPRYQNVQCEQCHGPGSDHAAKPAKGYGLIPNLQAACAACHTAQINPGFDAQAAWARIKH